MTAELRKLAADLRKGSKKRGTEKTVKCAQIAQAVLALEHIRRKIGA